MKAMDSGVLGKPIAADLSMKFHRSQEHYNGGGWRDTIALEDDRFAKWDVAGQSTLSSPLPPGA